MVESSLFEATLLIRKFKALFCWTKWNQIAQASFPPPSMQAHSRQPLSVSLCRWRETHSVHVTVLSPEKIRMRFSSNKPKANIHVPLLACLQPEGRAETPAQARREQGSCRGAEQGGLSKTLVSFSGMQSCSNLCSTGTFFAKGLWAVLLLPNLRFLGKSKIRKEREILLLQEALQLEENTIF